MPVFQSSHRIYWYITDRLFMTPTVNMVKAITACNGPLYDQAVTGSQTTGAFHRSRSSERRPRILGVSVSNESLFIGIGEVTSFRSLLNLLQCQHCFMCLLPVGISLCFYINREIVNSCAHLVQPGRVLLYVEFSYGKSVSPGGLSTLILAVLGCDIHVQTMTWPFTVILIFGLLFSFLELNPV